MTLALCILAALHGPPADRAHALEPLFTREERNHRLPHGLLAKVARRESDFRYWAVGDHRHAFGLLQVHRDAIPGVTFTRSELMRPDVNAHVGALRLVLARQRCGGGPWRYAANYNGRRCGANPYRIARR